MNNTSLLIQQHKLNPTSFTAKKANKKIIKNIGIKIEPRIEKTK